MDEIQGVNQGDPAAAPTAGRAPLLEIAVLLLLGMALFGWRLGSHDLWPTDEPRFGQVAKEMRARGDFVVLSLNDHLYTEKPPLFFWAIDGFAALRGGVDEWAARLPSALAGVLSLLVILVFGESLFDRRTGFLGALIFATSVQILERARWASIDMTLTLFVTVAVALLWRAASAGGEGRSPWPARLAWLAMGLATLAKGPVGLALPILVVVPALLLAGDRRAVPRLFPLSGILIYMAVTLAWFGPFAARIGPDQAFRILTRQTVTRYVDAWNGRQPFWFYVWRFPVGFFPWSILLPWSVVAALLEFREPERRAGRFLLVWVGVVLLFFSCSTGKRGVYIMPLYPAAALTVARLFTRDARRAIVQGTMTWAALAVTAGVAVVTFGARRAPDLAGPAWGIGACLLAGGLAAPALARAGRSIAAARVLAATMAVILLVATEAVFPYVNRHLNLRGFAEQVRDRLRPEIPLATTEEKRDAWVFYSGRFVEELDTRPRLLAYLAAGPRRDLLIEEEELREIRPALPEGTTEVLEGRVSGRPYHMLRLPPSAGAPTDPATTGAGR
ncbi:MAG TPA: glycosyltransferase family 39 protein [Patescibacteria group bacterium]|nr:glycosyltransferase family 39 protein [Patescibacteria group bacterium]